MDIRLTEQHKSLLKVAYYFVTLACLSISALALYKAYINLHYRLAYWVCLGAAILLYIGVVLLVLCKLRGTAKIWVHSIALQFLPLCATVAVFCLLSVVELKPAIGAMNKYERAFNDLQRVQKSAAVKNGLSPFKSRAELEMCYEELCKEGKLVKISSNSGYVVRQLTYSEPYVVPKVKSLLDDIAHSFQEKTNSKVMFEVTSVLRTEEDVAKLRKVNANASSASCHCNATTIDISYIQFSRARLSGQSDADLRLALAQAIYELRKAGRCYVKIEQKQCCYHITVR